jgi:hypothetical protein
MADRIGTPNQARRIAMIDEEVISDTESDPKDYLIPGVLLSIGILIFLAWSVILGGLTGLAVMAVYLPIRLVVQVVVGVIACFFTARIMGTSFGYLKTAIIKLAAIFVFPAAATFFIPWVGWILALLLYWKLIEWLFELEAMETIVLAIVIWFVNIGAMFFILVLRIPMI